MTGTAPAARWMVATAGLCVTGLVGSWLLLLGPMLDAAAATRAQAASVHEQNDALESRLDALRADFAGIDGLRTELAALRLQLPDDAQLSHLSREIDGAARAAGVTLVRVEVGDALDVTTAAATAAAAAVAAAPVPTPPVGTEAAADATATDPAATGTATGTGTAAGTVTGTAATAPVVPPSPAVPGMLAIPLTTTVTGSVDGVRAFLTALQLGLTRGVLVTTLAVTALEESAGGDGSPAAADGDVQAVVGALAYVLPAQPAGRAGAATVEAGTLPPGGRTGAFRSSAPEAPAPAPPAPDPAAVAADAIAAAVEQRLAAATAAAESAASASAAASAAAQAAAAQAATPPAAGGPVLDGEG